LSDMDLNARNSSGQVVSYNIPFAVLQECIPGVLRMSYNTEEMGGNHMDQGNSKNDLQQEQAMQSRNIRSASPHTSNKKYTSRLPQKNKTHVISEKIYAINKMKNPGTFIPGFFVNFNCAYQSPGAVQ
jgi:hypothetical protein